MITVIDGLTGSGKTFVMTSILYKYWKAGDKIYPNYELLFSEENENIEEWEYLDETSRMTNGVVAIDEGQKFFDAVINGTVPAGFWEKVAQHRKDFIEFITTTQDFLHIHWRVRSNVHQRITCRSIFRIPRNERILPLLQLIKVTPKLRRPDHEERTIKWIKKKSYYLLISRLWTKKRYNTYRSIGLDRFLCKVFYQRKPGQRKGKWRAKIYSRQLVINGKARM